MGDIETIKDAIESNFFACVQTAPSIRTAIGEAFGMPPGELLEGKLVAALHHLGFKRVFETDFGAELRIMEETAELNYRIEHAPELLPMFTSCCPSWVMTCVRMHPEIVPFLSTCKSPMEMVSSIAKEYLTYERNWGNVSVSAIMPCFAKKNEGKNGNTDGVITTMELARWIKEEGIDFKSLKNGFYDAPFGMTSSAGTIYASTGGVTEATLRTYAALYGGTCDNEEHLYEEKIIGQGIREKEILCGKTMIKVAMVEGAMGVKKFCDDFKAGENRDYHMVEMMFCNGGCVGGPGMPNAGQNEAISARIRALKHYDDASVVRSAHENHLIQQLYKDYLGKPYQKKAKSILHVNDFKSLFP